MEYVVPIVALEAVGDSMLKLYATGSAWTFATAGYVFYGMLLWLFIRVIQVKGLAWANSAWDGYSNIATMFVGIVIFKEKVSTQELIGMLFIAAGCFLLGT